ncbi:RNA-directed DNA polymerase [Abeliophyllum distichum]|uniref:RNA-directed DNA polymerase n=1 Tax=Abeliophyllum distichum TaxID=126358 RepID=A0ABD1RDX0_9LAMI
MELTEYERKFEERSCYAPYLVSTELMKARHYERWLRSAVRQIVSFHALPTFKAVVKMAQTVPFSGLKVKVQGQQNDSGKKNWCGEPGHYVSQCWVEPTKVNDQANKEKARVFAMTHEEATQNPNVITALQAEKLLKKIDCQGFLVNLTGTLSEEVLLDNVPVV